MATGQWFSANDIPEKNHCQPLCQLDFMPSKLLNDIVLATQNLSIDDKMVMNYLRISVKMHELGKERSVSCYFMSENNFIWRLCLHSRDV